MEKLKEKFDYRDIHESDKEETHFVKKSKYHPDIADWRIKPKHEMELDLFGGTFSKLKHDFSLQLKSDRLSHIVGEIKKVGLKGEFRRSELKKWRESFHELLLTSPMHYYTVTVKLKDDPNLIQIIDSFPSELSDLLEVVQSSRSILELKDNWDDEGSPAYSEATWNRAVLFFLKNALWVWKNHATIIDAPRILPGPKGTIDLHWETETYELLINIPIEPSAPATFYGDDRGNLSIKGTFDPSVYNKGLLMWLTTKR